MATCPECGFDWERSPTGLLDDLRAVDVVELPPAIDVVRARPEPDVWSALEYTAHLRDALRFYDERIRRTLRDTRPQLTAYGFHEACEQLGYNAEGPEQTVRQLHEQGRVLTARVTPLDTDKWARVAIGSDGDERTVLTLARRAAHEAHHHALDIRRVLAAVDGSRHAH